MSWGEGKEERERGRRERSEKGEWEKGGQRRGKEERVEEKKRGILTVLILSADTQLHIIHTSTLKSTERPLRRNTLTTPFPIICFALKSLDVMRHSRGM